MRIVNRRVYNLIVMATATEGDELVRQLEQVGLRLADEAVEANLGIRSRLLPIAGGGFVEIANELSPGSFAHGNAFTVTPRLASIGYTTDDLAADMAYWRERPGTEHAFVQAGSWRRKDGSFGYYIGGWPVPPVGNLFFALQEHRLFPPPYMAEADTAPAVRRVAVRGPDAERWRRWHEELFSLPSQNGVLHAGETELMFEMLDAPANELFVTLAVPKPGAGIRLAGGGIEFVQTESRGGKK